MLFHDPYCCLAGKLTPLLTPLRGKGVHILWLFSLPLAWCQNVSMCLHRLSMTFTPAGRHKGPPILISPEEQKICLHAWQHLTAFDRIVI